MVVAISSEMAKEIPQPHQILFCVDSETKAVYGFFGLVDEAHLENAAALDQYLCDNHKSIVLDPKNLPEHSGYIIRFRTKDDEPCIPQEERAGGPRLTVELALSNPVATELLGKWDFAVFGHARFWRDNQPLGGSRNYVVGFGSGLLGEHEPVVQMISTSG